MRLMNIQKSGGFEYRVIMDSEKETTNYIERTKGVYFDKKAVTHKCIMCMKEADWWSWLRFNKSKVECSQCKQPQTLEILVMFDSVADDLS